MAVVGSLDKIKVSNKEKEQRKKTYLVRVLSPVIVVIVAIVAVVAVVAVVVVVVVESS